MTTSPTSPAADDGRRPDPDAPYPTPGQMRDRIKAELKAHLPVTVDHNGNPVQPEGDTAA